MKVHIKLKDKPLCGVKHNPRKGPLRYVGARYPEATCLRCLKAVEK